MQRINRYPSPLTPLVNDGTGDITHGDYDVAIDNVEAGTYVFAADVQNSGTQTGINVMLFDSDWNPLFSSNKIGHVQTTFTLKKPDRVRIRPNQTGVTISNVIVERADTYALTSVGGGASGFLHRADRAVLAPSRRVVADEDQEPASGRARCQANPNMGPVGQAGRKRLCDVHERRQRLQDSSALQKYEAGRHGLPAPNKRIRCHRALLPSPVGRIVCQQTYSAVTKRRVGGSGPVLHGDRILHRRASGIQRPASSRNRMLHRGHGSILALDLGLGVAA